jgi:LL-diaminopimelate aminotransferase
MNEKNFSIDVAERLRGIEEYYFSQKLREIETLNKEGKAIINLGIGSPDLAPHPDVIKVLQEESSRPGVHGYQSYKGSVVLRTAISNWYRQWYNVALDPATEVLPLMGSKEGILHICMTYLDKGDKALVPNPGYPTYSSAVALAGGECISYELKEENRWAPDWEQLEKQAARQRIKLLFVNYPHMPTGQLPTKELFEQLVRFAKKHNILIVHDNPYSFILNEKPMSLLEVDKTKEQVIELNSLSKSHNMAGWRIGMLCGAEKHINNVLRFKSNMDSGMFLPLQLAAAKALTLGKEWHDELNKVYAERRNKVFELLELLDCQFSKEQAGLFVWAKIPSAYESGYSVSDEVLYGSNVFLTPGGIFGSGGNKYIRVSLCSNTTTIQQAIERIKK